MYSVLSREERCQKSRLAFGRENRIIALLLVILLVFEIVLVPVSIQIPTNAENLLEKAARKAIFEPPLNVKNWLNSQFKKRGIRDRWCDNILVWFTGFPVVKATVEIVMKHRKSGYRQVWYVAYIKPKWIIWKKKTKTKYIIYKKKKVITGYHYVIHCWKRPV